MHTLKLVSIGNAVGVILPTEVLSKLNIQEGDALIATDGPGASLILTSEKDEIARQIAFGVKFMDEYEETFRILAK